MDYELTYLTVFIDQKEQDDLVNLIDQNNWSNDLKRRTQHYGYKYNYTSKIIDRSMKVGELPGWTEWLIDKFLKNNIIQEKPDQLIINEYTPGQGIANHIDCVPCFKDTIISLSLLTTCIMNFTHKWTKEIIPIVLEPKSLIILEKEARFDWMHGIPARKSDEINGIKIDRGRRISLTFRRVIV